MIRPLMNGEPAMMPPVSWLRRMPQGIGGAVSRPITMTKPSNARPAYFQPLLLAARAARASPRPARRRCRGRGAARRTSRSGCVQMMPIRIEEAIMK